MLDFCRVIHYLYKNNKYKLMSKENKPEQTDAKTIEDLKGFLKNKFKPQPNEVKPDVMSNKEMKSFLAKQIIPSFIELKKQLSEFNFQGVDYASHSRAATFRVSEDLSQFQFKVDIDNVAREIKIFYELRYRVAKKKKLIEIYSNTEKEKISFKDIDTITSQLIISLFTKWYMNKDSLIEKDVEAGNK